MHRYGRHGEKAWLLQRSERTRLHFLSPVYTIVCQKGLAMNSPLFTGSTAEERYLTFATERGKAQAEKDNRSLDDPFSSCLLSRDDIFDQGREHFSSMKSHGAVFERWYSPEEAAREYLATFTKARIEKLEEITHATSKGSKALVISARKDKHFSEDTKSILAILRAERSLKLDGYDTEELTEQIITTIRNRAAVYHKKPSSSQEVH